MFCTLILTLLASICGVSFFPTRNSTEKPTFVLPHSINRYNDVEVTLQPSGPVSTQLLDFVIESSLVVWHKEGRKTVWLTLPIKHADYLQTVLQHDFVCHHADKHEIVLTKLLVEGMESTIPHYANRTMGAAALVIDENNNVLVIKDRHQLRNGFKLPGGGVDVGEDIWQAAIREVKEETGIDTEFIGIVGWGEHHNKLWGCSDIYFCCLLRPLTFELQPQESEIAECCWMPYQEYKTIAHGSHLAFLQMYEKTGAPITSFALDQHRTLYAPTS